MNAETRSTGIPPRSRFVSYLDDGTPTTSAADWQMIVRNEPEDVASWLLYMHQHQRSDVLALLEAFTFFCNQKVRGSADRYIASSWRAFAKTRLPNLLSQIFCEPEMFATKEASAPSVTLTGR